ncbi:MAG: FG-GAP repeat protein, partial [Rudanella sp.]|nr:FG-GAP repeat protein [Rudanella sp.]
QQARLTASDGAAYDDLGISVALSGDYALVGAYSDDVGANGHQGSAYVFVRGGGTWTQQDKLTASDGAASDNFGNSVAISGNYALVGAYLDDVNADNDQGSAYIFVRSGSSWTQQAKLTASDGAGGDNFGSSVAISGDYALVGAYGDAVGANTTQGSAYVFVRSGSSWTQQDKLTASDGAWGDFFGESVAISGNYALVGASRDDVGAGADRGSAYVFVRSGSSWTQQAKLTASDGVSGDRLGISVALSGDHALVGAYEDDIGANNDQGSAYLFKRTGTSWSLVRAVTDNSPANTNNGQGVGISNGSFIIGGPGFENGKGKVAFGTVDN